MSGWLISLAIVVSVTVLATGKNPPKPNTAPSLAALAVKIALGAALVVIAVRRYRRIASGTPTSSLLKQLHVAPRDAQMILGHAHISTTTQVCTHADEEARNHALTSLNRLLGGSQ